MSVRYRRGSTEWNIAAWLGGADYADNLNALSLCDYGAQEFKAGRCDGIQLNVVGRERQIVQERMERLYPDVPYRITWPGGLPDQTPGESHGR